MFKKNLNRYRGGHKAREAGKYFENLIQSVLTRQGWLVVRIPDAGRLVNGVKFIRQSTPFDLFAVRDGKVVFFDAKTVATNTFAQSRLTRHQVDILRQIESHQFKAGYVIYFQNLETVSFYSGSKLNSLQKRQSLKPEDGVSLGHQFLLSFDPIFLDDKN